MICKKCHKKMKEIKVNVEGAKLSSKAFECSKCGDLQFDRESGLKVVKELEKKKKSCPLNIEQKITKLSYDRLGFYFNKDIVRCLDLKPGEKVHLTVLDKKNLLINRN